MKYLGPSTLQKQTQAMQAKAVGHIDDINGQESALQKAIYIKTINIKTIDATTIYAKTMDLKTIEKQIIWTKLWSSTGETLNIVLQCTWKLGITKGGFHEHFSFNFYPNNTTCNWINDWDTM